MKKILFTFLASVTLSATLRGQVPAQFSGETAKFTEELTAFMGTLVNKPEKAEIDLFNSYYDSTLFDLRVKDRIVNVASQLRGRRLSQIPGFIFFARTLNSFVNTKQGQEEISAWLDGLSEMAFDPRFSNASVEKFIEVTGLLLVDNTIYSAGSVRWKTRDGTVEFVRDTVLKIEIKAVTLQAFLGKDSTEIYDFTGIYYPDIFKLHCQKGKVTWEKAGYDPSAVFATVSGFDIDVTKSEFTCDSSLLTHPTYFQEPVLGKLSDRAVGITSPDKATMPKFETYETRFFIKDIYKGVDYEGGLALEGAIVRGTGTNWFPASVKLYRNDTLAIDLTSRNFILSQKNINSYETSATLFLGTDSVYHSNLGFSYNTENREVSMFRTTSPFSRSPYYDSYHNLDLYFEHLSWDMDNPFIIMSRTRGSSIGAAKFESISFYNEANFFRLMRLDDVHPLYRVRDYAKVYGADVFPLEGFAKWMRMPLEQATALVIELANNGFLFFDRNYGEVTIKKKVDDFIASSAKKKDYDAITINSETRDQEENAILDLKSFDLHLAGVSMVSMSDSQKVAIRPYGGRLTVGRNRSISFDGVVQAGLFTIYGKKFSFNYDTFRIRLEKIDSIKIAVETGERDAFGRPVIKRIDNMIENATAQLFIDAPNNKSGIRSLKQYPIISASTNSYIFYDDIPGLEGLYERDKFYFKLDPFTYNNLDHYTNDQMSLDGEFIAGGVTEPMRQTLTVQPDTSLGFTMNIPSSGIPIYNGRGTLYNHLSMSNSGLIASGTIDHLTATVKADTFRLFPDYMISRVHSFEMRRDSLNRFPELKAADVDIQWLTGPDEWYAVNNPGKNFNMFGNGTTLDGTLILTPARLRGKGILDMADARITSETFAFGQSTIVADTSDYYLKALKGDGYGFVANNANTRVDFVTQRASFSLNTDSSLVVFPELEYISKMTNFEYDIRNKVLDMSQRGRELTKLMTADELLKVPPGMAEKPTFYSTNNMKDTVKFQSGSASYFLQDEYVEIKDVNYIPVADALIQPGAGTLYIGKGAKIRQTDSALVAVNNRHLIHSAKINIESSSSYYGSGKYDYRDETGQSQVIEFTQIKVDTMSTKAVGFIPVTQNFTLSPAFTFTGDVSLSAREPNLRFTGAAGIITLCPKIKSSPVKFSAAIDPGNILIPIDDKPRDINDNLLFSGTFITLDSAGVYSTFLSERHSWSDNPIISAEGFLFHDKGSGKYRIASLEKLSDLSRHGNMVTFDRNQCLLVSEGKINFGVNFDLLKMSSSGVLTNNTDSSLADVRSMLSFSFFFSPEALKIMAEDIRSVPTLRAVNLSSEFNSKAMRDLIGEAAAKTLNEELQLFGVARSLPKEYSSQIMLNDVTLKWNPYTMSFISSGKIGIGFIGDQPMNVYVDGWVEIQRKRSGDLLDIYIKANDNVWYWFSYFRGMMMSYSSNLTYNDILSNTKEKARRDPKATARVDYVYMLGLRDRLLNFLRRMETGGRDSGINY
ncbi:hypothetical protein EG827_09080 [bacterium]|nr:hypothetical protein [bacterium]